MLSYYLKSQTTIQWTGTEREKIFLWMILARGRIAGVTRPVLPVPIFGIRWCERRTPLTYQLAGPSTHIFKKANKFIDLN